MKSSFIMSLVWLGVIVLLISFGVTVLFIENVSNDDNKSNLNEEYSSTNFNNNEINNVVVDSGDIKFTESKNGLNNNLENQPLYTDIVQNKVNNGEKNLDNNIDSEKDLDNNVNSEKDLDNNINYEKNSDNNITENNESIETIEIVNSSSFIKPVNGEIMNHLSLNKLIYSKTLNEWKIHYGTDYFSKLGDEVYAVRSGVIKESDFNYIYGNYIIIEHENGYKSLYANVTVLDALKVGDRVAQGQVIGYVAESFGFESAEKTHLHFELKKNDEYMEI